MRMIHIEVPTGALYRFISVNALPRLTLNRFIAELLPRNWLRNSSYSGAYLLFKRPSCKSPKWEPRARQTEFNLKGRVSFGVIGSSEFHIHPHILHFCFHSIDRQLDAEKILNLRAGLCGGLTIGFDTFWIFTLGK